jgi:hypothetical protein
LSSINISVDRIALLSGGFRSKSISLPFPASRGCQWWTLPLSSEPVVTSQILLTLHHYRLFLAVSSSSFRDLCDFIGPIPIVRGNLPF